MSTSGSNIYWFVRTIEGVWKTCLGTVIIIFVVVQNLATSERLLSIFGGKGIGTQRQK